MNVCKVWARVCGGQRHKVMKNGGRTPRVRCPWAPTSSLRHCHAGDHRVYYHAGDAHANYPKNHTKSMVYLCYWTPVEKYRDRWFLCWWPCCLSWLERSFLVTRLQLADGMRLGTKPMKAFVRVATPRSFRWSPSDFNCVSSRSPFLKTISDPASIKRKARSFKAVFKLSNLWWTNPFVREHTAAIYSCSRSFKHNKGNWRWLTSCHQVQCSWKCQ